MDTIRNYVDMMFKDLPKTKEIINMKLNILDHMEDTYNELIAEGKTENEAIGTVISQFGNIDELKEELGIHTSSNTKDTSASEIPFVGDDEVMHYLKFKFQFSYLVAIGVALCICSVIPTSFDGFNDTGTILMFFMIACAVAIFIISGIRNEDFEHFEKKPFQINHQLKEKIGFEFQKFKPKFGCSIAIGVALCILAPMIYMIVEQNILNSLSTIFSKKEAYNLVDGFASGAMFLTIAIGVFLLTSSSIRKGSYDTILQNEKKQAKYRQEEKENNLYSIVMGLVGILYLILGFCFGWWHPGWLLFPIAALFVKAITFTEKGNN